MKPFLILLLTLLLVGCSLFGEEAAPAPSDVDQNIIEQLETTGTELLATAVPATEPTLATEPTAVPPTEPAPTATATVAAAAEEGVAAETAVAPSEATNATAKSDSTTLRSGPGEEFPDTATTVESGAPLNVLGLDESGKWVNVLLENGENGWLPLEDIELNTPLQDIGIVLTLPAIPAVPTIPGLPQLPGIPTLPPVNVP